MSISIDSHTDSQVDAVVALLFGAIRAKFGAEACAHSYKWPVRTELVPSLLYPSIAVYVPSERQERSDRDDDIRTVTLRIDYFAPPTPLDRIEKRWPLLRAVWALCLARLRIGYDPSVQGGDNVLQAAGFEVPGPTIGAVTYQTAPADTVNIVPSFSATVTMAVSQDFDWSDYDNEIDLVGIDTDGVHTGDPQNDVPSWDDTVDFP